MRAAVLAAALSLLAGPVRAVQTVVSLTFDDGSSDQLLARQILDQRGLKATFFIASGGIGSSGWYLTLDDLRALRDGGHEIGGHSLDHADLTSLSAAELRRQVCDDRANLRAWGFDAVSFAYPYGYHDATAEAAVRDCGYTAARGVGELGWPGAPVAETIPPLNAFATRAISSMQSGTTLAQMKKYVTDAEQAGGGWVTIVMHRVCDNCSTYSTTEANLAAFADWLAARQAQGTVVKTVAQVTGATPPAAPTLASISPSSAAAGSGSLTLTCLGSGFAAGAKVRWNNADRATTFVSSTQLTAATTAADLTVPGSAAVTVVNPDGGVSAGKTFAILSPPPPQGVIFYEPFDPPDRLITNEHAHWVPEDPAAVTSNIWDMPSGSLFVSGGSGWTGVPDNADPNAASSNGNNSAVFRLLTKRSDFGDVSVFLTLTHQGFTSTPSTPAQAYDGVHLVLRRQSATSYYYLSVNRRDNTAMIKKKTASGESILASAALVTPIGQPQSLQADVATQFNGSVALALKRDGAPLLSYVDSASPILGTGALGIFGDNSNFRFDDFAVTSIGSQPNPAPSLAALYPSSAPAASPNLTLALAGSGFISSSTVRWNGKDRGTVFVSSTQLTAAITAADLAIPTTANVTVFNPGPGGGTSTAKAFLVYAPPVPNPVPSIAFLSPSSVTAGSPALTLFLSGSGFFNGSTVRWNGQNRGTVFISSAQLSAAISTADLANPTTANVTVFNPGPGGGTSTAQA
ncbi:MAG: polysaccharide deacetylase family protein, partial [Elusimicrobia bacterium]|nr:polysaccharide deacetylase family protein [Elusimicrobiota bacterium]